MLVLRFPANEGDNARLATLIEAARGDVEVFRRLFQERFDFSPDIQPVSAEVVRDDPDRYIPINGAMN